MKPRSRFGLRFNFDLVIAEIERWPVATFLVATAAAAATSIAAIEFRYSTFDFAAVFVGYFIGTLGGKAVWLLIFYPLVYRARFQGSSLVAMFIAMIPVFAFYAAALYSIAIETGETPPIEVVTLFMPFSYVLFSLFFGGFASLLNWMHRPRAPT